MLMLTKNIVFFSAILLCAVTLFPIGSGKICKSIDVRNHVQNLNKLRNCTEITGNLSIVLLENTKSETDFDPYVFPELQKVTGYVMLYKLKYFTSLGKLFPNLRLIRGLTLLTNYALILYDLPNIREVCIKCLHFYVFVLSYFFLFITTLLPYLFPTITKQM